MVVAQRGRDPKHRVVSSPGLGGAQAPGGVSQHPRLWRGVAGSALAE